MKYKGITPIFYIHRGDFGESLSVLIRCAKAKQHNPCVVKTTFKVRYR